MVLYFSETAQIEAVKQQMSQEISDLKKEKVKLTHTASISWIKTENVERATTDMSVLNIDWHQSGNVFVQIFVDDVYITWGFVYRCS